MVLSYCHPLEFFSRMRFAWFIVVVDCEVDFGLPEVEDDNVRSESSKLYPGIGVPYCTILWKRIGHYLLKRLDSM